MHRLAYSLIAACLLAWSTVSQAAQPALELAYPTRLEEYAQCARLLMSAGDAPVRLEQKVLGPDAVLAPGDAMQFAMTHPSIAIFPAGFLRDDAPGLSEITRPFVFRDLAHFQAFSRSPFFEEEAGKVEDFRPLALVYTGTAYLAGKKPVREPGDFDGLSVNSYISGVKLWKARVGPLAPPPDQAAALKGGILDAVIITPIQAIRTGLSEAAPYYNQIDIQRFFMVLAVNAAAWREMSPPQRQALSAWAKKMANQCSARNFDAETRAIEALKKQGVQIIEPNRQAFDAQRPDPAEGIESDEGKAFIRRIQTIR